LLLAEWPVKKPRNWIWLVNKAESEEELAALRRAGDRGQPCGEERWMQRTAKALGIESSLRPVGRPKKKRGVEEWLMTPLFQPPCFQPRESWSRLGLGCPITIMAALTRMVINEHPFPPATKAAAS
jgi:hypothetical protein